MATKTDKNELIKSIGQDLLTYLKTGTIYPVPIISSFDFEIEDIEALISIHFLLTDEVEKFIFNLPENIRELKISTKTGHILRYLDIKGQIDWNRTINEWQNTNDKLRYICKEKTREFSTPENIVLKEFLRIVSSICKKILKKYEATERKGWLKKIYEIKQILNAVYDKNIYLAQVDDYIINHRIVDKVKKSRKLIYRECANLLSKYNKLTQMNFDLKEVYQLLADTNIFPDEDNKLFELYWVVRILKECTSNKKMYVMDGKNNLVAKWHDDYFVYELYHDSTGDNELLFKISIDEILGINNEYVERTLQVINEAKQYSRIFIGNAGRERFDNLWGGRPDIIILKRRKTDGELIKLILCEIKYTNNKDYALQGLFELLEYVHYVKDKSGHFINSQQYSNNDEVQIQGFLFVDNIEIDETKNDDNIKIFNISSKNLPREI